VTTYTGAIQAEIDNKKTIVVNAAQDITTAIQEIQGGSIITLPIITFLQEKLQNASYSANNMTVKSKKFGNLVRHLPENFPLIIPSRDMALPMELAELQLVSKRSEYSVVWLLSSRYIRPANQNYPSLSLSILLGESSESL